MFSRLCDTRIVDNGKFVFARPLLNLKEELVSDPGWYILNHLWFLSSPTCHYFFTLHAMFLSFGRSLRLTFEATS